MLKNLLSEEGESRFVDISKEIGLKAFTQTQFVQRFLILIETVFWML